MIPSTTGITPYPLDCLPSWIALWGIALFIWRGSGGVFLQDHSHQSTHRNRIFMGELLGEAPFQDDQGILKERKGKTISSASRCLEWFRLFMDAKGVLCSFWDKPLLDSGITCVFVGYNYLFMPCVACSVIAPLDVRLEWLITSNKQPVVYTNSYPYPNIKGSWPLYNWRDREKCKGRYLIDYLTYIIFQ